MRVLKYTMADYLKAKKKMGIFLIIVPVIALFMACSGTSSHTALLTSLLYCLFAGIILAGLPYTYEKIEETGFFSLLPGKTQEQVFGHFLFGFITTLVSLMLGLICWGIEYFLGFLEADKYLKELSGISGMLNISLLLFGAGLIFVAVQDFLCTLFRFESIQIMNLLRILPGFIFFFGFSMLLGSSGYETMMKTLDFLFSHSKIVFLICFGVFLLTAYGSGLIMRSRE